MRKLFIGLLVMGICAFLCSCNRVPFEPRVTAYHLDEKIVGTQTLGDWMYELHTGRGKSTFIDTTISDTTSALGLLYYKGKIVTLCRFDLGLKMESGDRIVTPWGQMQFFPFNNPGDAGFLLQMADGSSIDTTIGRLFTIEQLTRIEQDNDMLR